MIDSGRYFTRYQNTLDLYKELKTLIDYVISLNEDGVRDVLFKYKDQLEISFEAQQAYSNEFGGDYISDIMTALAPDNLGNAVSYLTAILLQKGSRTGSDIMLDLLFLNFDLVEHWEFDKDRTFGGRTLQIGEFKIDVSTVGKDLTQLIGILGRLAVFFKNYVHPVVFINLLAEGEYTGVFPSSGYPIQEISALYEQQFIFISSDTYEAEVPSSGIPENTVSGDVVDVPSS